MRVCAQHLNILRLRANVLAVIAAIGFVAVIVLTVIGIRERGLAYHVRRVRHRRRDLV